MCRTNILIHMREIIRLGFAPIQLTRRAVRILPGLIPVPIPYLGVIEGTLDLLKMGLGYTQSVIYSMRLARLETQDQLIREIIG